MTTKGAPTATTRVAGVIGDPVAHSLSPVLHNTAYNELGVDWVYVALHVLAGHGPEAVAAVRHLRLAGLSVTMPHKEAAADACDDLDADAAALRSVNCVTLLDDDRLHGASTDGEGFIRSLRDAGFDPSGRDAVVLGAGGAGRAVALALARAGGRVVVVARRAAPATAAADLAKGRAAPWSERAEAAAGADLVVDATPMGMGGDRTCPLPEGALRSGQVVADLVYLPATTPLLERAAAAGSEPIGGLGMLVHQAALQVERWTGFAAPVEAMRRAVEAELAGRPEGARG